MRRLSAAVLGIAIGVAFSVGPTWSHTLAGAGGEPPLTLDWARNILTIRGTRIPGGSLEILYLEAYCRPGSTDRDWKETVIGHRTDLLERSDDGRIIRLRCVLRDGVTVDHVIRARRDEVEFHLTARNPTERPSRAHWAQPCVRVGAFTGLGNPENPATYEYIRESFVFLEDGLTRMPTPGWATEARYVPGQVWAAPGVSRDDVNPRPLSPHIPANGLIGCFSSDRSLVLATAWEPYQELFQGVITCLHSDFRLGGLAPGEEKIIRGKIYLVENDIAALVERYERDFPEQATRRERHVQELRARRAFGGLQPRVDPTGARVALSYQGGICTIGTGGGALSRLTAAAGIDVEPCWSPDGETIAFLRTVSFGRGRLCFVDARTGSALEPGTDLEGEGRLAYLPDGTRLFGRLAPGGQPLALSLLDLSSGRLEAIRLPDEVRGGSRPVWALSPGGDEIVYAVHRDRPGEQEGNNGPGSSLWRIALAGEEYERLFAFPARIHDLDWSESFGILLVSDFGASHHDLWQLDPSRPRRGARKLTFGQADEDRPSVARRGSQIVFSDNRSGATAIVRMNPETGERDEIEMTGIDAGEPTGRLRLRLLDRATGRPVVARVSLRRRDGKFHAPPGALYRFTSGLLHFYARYLVDLELPGGEYELVVFRGPEYLVHRQSFTVEAAETRERAVLLERWSDLASLGYYGGENHIHANYGHGAWYSNPASVRDQCEGEDLHVGNVMVANSDGEGVYDREFFRGGPDPLSGPSTILYWSEEFRSTIWGHLTLVGLDQLVEPVFTGFPGTTNPYDVPANWTIAHRARRRGGVVSYTHPASDPSSLYDGAYSAKGLPVDVALGEIDTLDVLGFGYGPSLGLWYRLLNCGFRLPAAAGTDCFLNRLHSYPPGWGRAYVRIEGDFTHEKWIAGQKAGRSFVTTGPTIELSVDGREPGDTVLLSDPAGVPIRSFVRSGYPLQSVELVVNGKVCGKGKIASGGLSASLEATVDCATNSWIAVRAHGPSPAWLPAGSQVAHTNPVWIVVESRPLPARGEARFFLGWIDRLEEDLRRRGRIPFALEGVEHRLEEARAVYRRIADS